MNRISFSTCVQRYGNCIGKTDSKGRKIYLNYTDQKGWGVKRLSCLQDFYRTFFGLYKSTHSKTICRAWKKETGQNHISRISLKQLLKGRFIDKPPALDAISVDIQKDLVIIGNSDIQSADIVCFAEDHRDIKFHRKMIDIINSNAEEVDLVLTESFIEKVWLKEKLEVRNWDYYKEFFLKNIPSYVENLKRFEAFIEAFWSIFPKGKNYTDQDVKRYAIELENLHKEFLSLGKALKVPEKDLQDAIERSKAGLTHLSIKKIGNKKRDSNLIAILQIISAFDCLSNQLGLPESYCSPEELKVICESVIPRNRGLIASMEQGRNEGKKVFVEAGAGHLLPFFESPEAAKEVEEYLHKNRFVIITTPELYQKSLKA